MQTEEVRLGLCSFDNQLLYAVGSSKKKPYLQHIGAIDFNFDVNQALMSGNKHRLPGLNDALLDLQNRFESRHLGILLNPAMECWTILPKLVYDNAGEREARIKILMNGVDRKHIHATWHALSTKKSRLLQLQTHQTRQNVQYIINGNSEASLISAFEIGEQWINYNRPGGSFLTICCFKNCIAVSSFVLNKLRGTTYIPYDHAEDLPYLWLQYLEVNPWMTGLHEEIHVYGYNVAEILEILQPFWDDAGSVITMNSLQKMRVSAKEETYSFQLERAFPAIMMAV